MSEFQPTLPTEELTSVTAWLAPYWGGFPQLLQNRVGVEKVTEISG